MFYFDWKVNIVDILINLIIVIITTGITYFLFSVLPVKRRKRMLSYRLSAFRDDIFCNILDCEEEFKKSYELYEEEITRIENDEEVVLVWSLIKIKEWANFIENFRLVSLIDTYFNDYWQGNELMLLINLSI